MIKLKEANLRKEKQLMKSNKKIKREEAMKKYVFPFSGIIYIRLIAGDPLQTPLTNKFFSMDLAGG